MNRRNMKAKVREVKMHPSSSVQKSFVRRGTSGPRVFLFILALMICPFANTENPTIDLSASVVQDFTHPNQRDTFPPRWFQNFIYKLRTKNDPLPVYEEPNPLFPENTTYRDKKPCEVDFEGYDPTVRESKKELPYEILFSHTHEEVKKYYPGREMLRAEGRLTRRDGGYTDLTLKFIWAAEDPGKYYGNFRNKNPVEINLTQNKQITLYNRSPAAWEMSDDGKYYIMTARYSIHSHQKKLLQNHSLKNMRVYWERGYQDYAIYHTGMLMNQLKCL